MIIISLTALVFLPDLLGIINPPHSELIGMITDAQGDVRIRQGESINWRAAKKNDQIYSQSYIFTGNNSRLHYRLIDDSSINVGSNSMVYLGSVKANNVEEKSGINLELIEGSVQANLSPQSDVKQITSDDTVVEFKQNQKLLVQFDYSPDKDSKVYVFDGDVSIKRNDNVQNLQSGQVASMNDHASQTEVEQLSKQEVENMIRAEEARRKENLADIQRRRQIRFLINSFFSFFR